MEYNVFFDESGNTGDNLLDKDQPFYVLSSNNYTDEEVEYLLEPLKNAKSEELHFKRLKKNIKYKNALIDIFNNNLITEEHIKYYYVDKEYALVCHIVDKLIEPQFFNMGHNMYKKGQNMSYANIIYLVGKNLIEISLFEKFLSEFQSLIRFKTDESINNFYRTVNQILENSEKDIKDVFYPIKTSYYVINELLADFDKYFLDLAAPTFTGLCNSWGVQLKQKFNVIHDDSKPIDFWKNYLDFISSDALPKKEVGYDYRKHTYPLMIERISFVNSTTCKQIQFADLVSSSLSYLMKEIKSEQKTDDEFANFLFKSKLANIESGHPIMFSPKFTPQDLGTEDDEGIDAVDYLTNNTSNFR